MKRRFLILTLFITHCSLFIANAQVGINNDNADPDASAMLDVKSTDKGFLVPRMTTAQRILISNPADGLLVFDNTTGSFWFFANTAWTELTGGGSPKEIADADNDTKIQVEESADEDKIRFDVGGVEIGFLDNKTFHLNAPGESLFIGKDAGKNDDGTNNQNMAIGFQAMTNNTTGSFNTASGRQALFYNTTGNANTASGLQALHFNTTGDYNTASGAQTLYSNTTGFYNTASGLQALFYNTTGNYNTASGLQALYKNTAGNYNTASGRGALYNNTAGSDNSATGHSALNGNTTGNLNTGLGRNANVSAGDLNNATAIGANAIVDASNKIQLGDANVTAVATSGTVTAAGFVGDGSALTNLPGDHLGNHTATQALDMANQHVINGGTVTATGFVGDGSALTNLPGDHLGNHTATQTLDMANQHVINGGTVTAAGFVGDGSALTNISVTNVSDADNDTKIQVEESADEDTIRFDIAGVEFAKMDGKTLHLAAPGESLFIGKDAGRNDDGTDNKNVAIGHEAMENNTAGSFNTASGLQTLYSNTSGNENTGIGYQSLFNNTTGYNNTSTGTNSLYNNTSGYDNTATGRQALYSNTTGIHNTASGTRALFSNTTGHDNTASGQDALFSNTTGHDNTASGRQALYGNTTGYENTAHGIHALYSNTEGFSNTASGRQALYSNITGVHNTASGRQALYSNTTGSFNTAFGTAALQNNVVGENNTASGRGALFNNTEGSGNSATGHNALNANTTGSSNTGLGRNANVSAGDLNNATAIGANAIVDASNKIQLGDANVTAVATSGTVTAAGFAVGSGGIGMPGSFNVDPTYVGTTGNSLSFAHVGVSEDFIGYKDNTFYFKDSPGGGDGADPNIETEGNIEAGSMNVVSGTSGNFNPAFRVRSNNTANLGQSTIGFYDENGQQQGWIGANVGPGLLGGDDAIQLFSQTGKNIVISDDDGSALFWLDGATDRIGIGISSPSYTLHVNGSAGKPGGGSWSNASDRRLKDVQGSFIRGLDAISALQPIYYNYKKDNPLDLPSEPQYVGFIAQEVQKVIPEAVETNKGEYLHVNNDAILWTMLNAIKELKKENETLQSKLEVMEALEQRLARLEAAMQPVQTSSLSTEVKSGE